MQQIKIPPHPLGLQCKTCMFWNEATRQEVILQANGQGIPLEQAKAMGMPVLGVPKATIAMCQFFPTWTPQMAESYCWQHKLKPEYIDKIAATVSDKSSA